jgi:hypothetical protein
MNAVSKQLIMTFGPMVLKSIVNSMLQEETLVEYRDKLIAFMRRSVDKTATQIDDMLIESLIRMIMTPGLYIEQTKEMCRMARQYITHTDNTWDDIVFVPILDRIEKLGVEQA